MATVIRSAQIADEAVTLSVQGRSGRAGYQAAPVKTSVPLGEAPTLQQAPAEHAEPQPRQDEKEEDSAWLAMREREKQLVGREKQLQERERRIQEELEDEHRQVRDAAYAEGLKHAEEEGAKLYRERLGALQNLIESLKEEFAGEVAGLEDVVVGIVFEAVCKIVGNSLHDRAGVLAVVREVANRVKDQEKLVLHVSPRDYDLLYQDGDTLLGGGQGIKHELVPDDRVAMGGCLIETSGGTIDGRLEIQLQQLRETLISARKMLPE